MTVPATQRCKRLGMEILRLVPMGEERLIESLLELGAVSRSEAEAVIFQALYYERIESKPGEVCEACKACSPRIWVAKQ